MFDGYYAIFATKVENCMKVLLVDIIEHDKFHSIELSLYSQLTNIVNLMSDVLMNVETNCQTYQEAESFPYSPAHV